MRQCAQCIHLFAVEQYIQFDEVRWSETVHMPIEGRIAFGDRFEFVVEVDHDLAQGHIEEQFHTVAADILLFDEFTAFTEAERHNRADEISCRDHRRTYIRLLDPVNLRQIRHAGRVMHLYHTAIFGIDIIGYVRHRGDDVHIEFAIQTLLHDLHVQQAKESAAKTEAQRHGTLRLEGQRSIVQLQFLQRGT